MARSGRLYRPCPSLVVVRTAPVAAFFALTEAPGTDAPELSVTVPVMVAVAACPRFALRVTG